MNVDTAVPLSYAIMFVIFSIHCFLYADRGGGGCVDGDDDCVEDGVGDGVGDTNVGNIHGGCWHGRGKAHSRRRKLVGMATRRARGSATRPTVATDAGSPIQTISSRHLASRLAWAGTHQTGDACAAPVCGERAAWSGLSRAASVKINNNRTNSYRLASLCFVTDHPRGPYR